MCEQGYFEGQVPAICTACENTCESLKETRNGKCTECGEYNVISCMVLCCDYSIIYLDEDDKER